MEAHKEEQLLSLLDAKKDEFCTANNNDCKSCLMEDGKRQGKTYKTPET